MKYIAFGFIWLVIISSLIDARMSTTTESSSDYLQKVMMELQNFNSPSTTTPHTKSTTNLQSNKFQQHNQDYDYSTHNPTPQRYQYEQTIVKDTLRNSKVSPHEKIDLQHSGSENVPQYYEVRSPSLGSLATKLQESGLLGLTRAELAAIYKNALNKNPLISVSSNVLPLEKRPQIVQTHLELPLRQPTYHHYYFLPLKTFESEMKKHYEHDPMSTHNVDYIAESASQKQLANPLFIAISTFVSMAVLFMMGILFLPKLHQHGIFSTREIQDDFLHLTYVVTKAIDKFAD